MSQRVRILCPMCASKNVRREATAEWNQKKQRWELSTLLSDGQCQDCARGNLDLVEVPIRSAFLRPSTNG